MRFRATCTVRSRPAGRRSHFVRPTWTMRSSNWRTPRRPRPGSRLRRRWRSCSGSDPSWRRSPRIEVWVDEASERDCTCAGMGITAIQVGLSGQGRPTWELPRTRPDAHRSCAQTPLLGRHKYLPYRKWFQNELASYVASEIGAAQALGEFLNGASVIRLARRAHVGSEKSPAGAERRSHAVGGESNDRATGADDEIRHTPQPSMQTLILKLNATGDVVRTTPLLDKLEGEVTWITADGNVPLVDGVAPSCRALSWADRATAGDRRYDLLVNLEDELATAEFAATIDHRRLYGAYADGSGGVRNTPDSNGWFDLSLISRFGRNAPMNSSCAIVEATRTWSLPVWCGVPRRAILPAQAGADGSARRRGHRAGGRACLADEELGLYDELQRAGSPRACA